MSTSLAVNDQQSKVEQKEEIADFEEIGGVSVEPGELVFRGPLDDLETKQLTLTNLSKSRRVSFRVNDYDSGIEAEPLMEVIPAGGKITVNIVFHPLAYVKRMNPNSSYNRHVVEIEWLPIPDAVVSSDGYEDVFAWTNDMPGVRCETVKLLFKRKVTEAEIKNYHVKDATESGEKTGQAEKSTSELAAADKAYAIIT